MIFWKWNTDPSFRSLAPKTPFYWVQGHVLQHWLCYHDHQQQDQRSQEQPKYGQQPTKRPGMGDLPNKNAANGTNQMSPVAV